MRKVYVIAALLFVVSCRSMPASSDDEVQVVKCVEAHAVEYVSRDFAALTTADDAVNLAFKLSGRVVDIPVAKGQLVRRGEVLAELDKRDVELQVSASEAAYREAQSRLARAERLLEHDAISEQEVEAIASSVAQSRSAYENALDLLADTRIVAPFDGIVERTYVDAYQRVASGETVVRIVNPISTTVGFTAPENLVSVLGLPTTRYSVELDAYPGVIFSATMKSYALTSSDALGFPVSLRLTDVDSARFIIRPGMTCLATVITPESDSDAVTLPMTSIYAMPGQDDYVWVVGDDGRVAKHRVEIGGPDGRENVVILSGVDDGDRVVVAGVYHLTEGERVRVIQ